MMVCSYPHLSPPYPTASLPLSNDRPFAFLLPFKGSKKVETKRDVKRRSIGGEGDGGLGKRALAVYTNKNADETGKNLRHPRSE
jgi:hypothetical protein